MVEKSTIDTVRYVFEIIYYNNNPLPPDNNASTTNATMTAAAAAGVNNDDNLPGQPHGQMATTISAAIGSR